MSMSDTCIEASRELLRYEAQGAEHADIQMAIKAMLHYVVRAESVVADCPITTASLDRAFRVFRQHLVDTPDWSGVESRCDDFNIIHAALKEPAFKPVYVAIKERE